MTDPTNDFNSASLLINKPASSADYQNTLKDLVAELHKRTGPPEVWLGKEIALSRHIASLLTGVRVLAKGRWMSPEVHYPAALIYDEINDRVEVLIPSGTDNAITVAAVRYFHATVPHAAIAREVMTNNPATDIQRS